MKTIRINALSRDSLLEAARQIKEYNSSLNSRTQTFVEKLGEAGLKVVNSVMRSVPSEERGSYSTELVKNSSGEITGAEIRLTGDKVLFIEFSAGIRYGTNSYPLPSGDKYGMGTYPGKGHWNQPYGWFYTDEKGNKKHSYGNRAYMPMYHAEEAIILLLNRTAKQVFGR